MRHVAFASGVLAVALICAFFVRSLRGPFYRLPVLAAEIITRQPSPPRRVGPGEVGIAVVRGLDGAIYATGGVFATFAGVILFYTTSGIGFPISMVSVSAGLFCASLVIFRVIDVWRALRRGDALKVVATQTKVGRARIYGSLWGDLTSGAAARGHYEELLTGASGEYYMQQRWAAALQPGTPMWVLRINGRDVLYAPASAPSRVGRHP